MSHQLLEAARNGDLETTKRLHAEGVDVTERGGSGFTATMLAAMRGHIATVKFLQAAGPSRKMAVSLPYITLLRVEN
jgi:ankyrin repeat protein